jgi:sigma-B regulation protein RsbU (phosphoserine phosphatase)
MSRTVLNVFGRDQNRQIALNPKGIVIGRSSCCDVVLEAKKVSRKHTRIFQDPFGRWIFEDLGSSNGTFINGKRIEAISVMPGELIVIGPFSLSITQSFEQEIEPDQSIAETNVIIEDFETEIFYAEIEGKDPSYPYLKKIIEIKRRLSELTSPSALYLEVCRYLSQQPSTVALILRVPERDKVLPKSPILIACHFGDNPDDTSTPNKLDFYPSLPVILNEVAFRVSRHVLEEVRSNGCAVMAKSIRSSDDEITSTLVDEHSPRALICVPLGDFTEEVDLLYIDIPIDRTQKSTPEDTFEFVQALAREIISTRKSLFLTQAKAERNDLNHELSLAKSIQSNLSPTIPKGLTGFEAAVYFKPVLWVGGDYCDVWSLADGRLAFAVGEVFSMGLPAAIASSDCRMLLRNTMSFHTDLNDIIKHINLQLIQNMRQGMPATLFLGLFKPDEGTLEYVNASHLQPLIIQPSSSVLPLGNPSNCMLGTEEATFVPEVVTITKDAQLIVFTDGITEARAPNDRKFGITRLTQVLRATDVRSADHTIDVVCKAIEDFRQTLAQQDDITIFVLANTN